MLSKFANDIKLQPVGDISNIAEDRAGVLKDLDRFKHWAFPKKIYVSGKRSKMLHLDKRNEIYRYKLSGTRFDIIIREKELSVLINHKLSIN